jgi:hypothetical protein
MKTRPPTAEPHLRGVDLDRVWERVIPISLFLTFAVVSAQKLVTWATTGHLWVDLRIYRAAAAEALAGGNPWNVIVDGYYYAAPPTSLIPYIPATFMPVDVATAVYAVVFAGAAVAAVRALRLPIWWVLFPPLFEAVIDLNSDVLVLALLLGGPVLGGAAVICKIYGAVPLLLQRRWTALAWAAAFALLSLPWWPTFIEQRGVILDRLAYQAGTLSAWGTWLLIPTVIALAYLRGRGASWLAVPALWPSTQLHYSTVGTPAAKRIPLIAFLFCFTIPLLPPIAVILEALRVALLNWMARRRATHPNVETDAAAAT